LPVVRSIPVKRLARHIWWTSKLRKLFGACGSLFFALAEELACPLLTCDERLARPRGYPIGVSEPAAD
jgi:predicted nucleic acid-binding protein